MRSVSIKFASSRSKKLASFSMLPTMGFGSVNLAKTSISGLYISATPASNFMPFLRFFKIVFNFEFNFSVVLMLSFAIISRSWPERRADLAEAMVEIISEILARFKMSKAGKESWIFLMILYSVIVSMALSRLRSKLSA